MCCKQGRSEETETYSEHTEIPSKYLASYIIMYMHVLLYIHIYTLYCVKPVSTTGIETGRST